jgi:hypothetical protein
MRRSVAALVLAVVGLSAGAVVAQPPEGVPVGRWERKMGKNHVRLTVEDGRLHVHFTGEKVATVHADYSVTKDRILYGVITSVDCDDEDESLENELLDQPFSCRFRVDEGTLTVRDLKISTLDHRESNWSGRFRAVAPAPPPAPPGPY